MQWFFSCNHNILFEDNFIFSYNFCIFRCSGFSLATTTFFLKTISNFLIIFVSSDAVIFLLQPNILFEDNFKFSYNFCIVRCSGFSLATTTFFLKTISYFLIIFVSSDAVEFFFFFSQPQHFFEDNFQFSYHLCMIFLIFRCRSFSFATTTFKVKEVPVLRVFLRIFL